MSTQETVLERNVHIMKIILLFASIVVASGVLMSNIYTSVVSPPIEQHVSDQRHSHLYFPLLLSFRCLVLSH